jgi:hypothetical protein
MLGHWVGRPCGTTTSFVPATDHIAKKSPDGKVLAYQRCARPPAGRFTWTCDRPDPCRSERRSANRPATVRASVEVPRTNTPGHLRAAERASPGSKLLPMTRNLGLPRSPRARWSGVGVAPDNGYTSDLRFCFRAYQVYYTRRFFPCNSAKVIEWEVSKCRLLVGSHSCLPLY